MMEFSVGWILVCVTDANLNGTYEWCHGMLAVAGMLLLILDMLLCAETWYVCL